MRLPTNVDIPRDVLLHSPALVRPFRWRVVRSSGRPLMLTCCARMNRGWQLYGTFKHAV